MCYCKKEEIKSLSLLKPPPSWQSLSYKIVHIVKEHTDRTHVRECATGSLSLVLGCEMLPDQTGWSGSSVGQWCGDNLLKIPSLWKTQFSLPVRFYWQSISKHLTISTGGQPCTQNNVEAIHATSWAILVVALWNLPTHGMWSMLMDYKQLLVGRQ